MKGLSWLRGWLWLALIGPFFTGQPEASVRQGGGAASPAGQTGLSSVAITLAPDQLTAISARLNGQVNPNGSPTMAWFEWGTNTNYGNVTAVWDVGQGMSLSNIDAVVAGLGSGPEYQYRLMVSNAFGMVAGTNWSFNLNRFFPTPILYLPELIDSSVAWGDYDNDGRLDFLLTGNRPGPVSQLWRNTGSSFTNVTASVAPGLPGVAQGSVAWGDYDRDGRLDFVLTGYGTSQLWWNTGSGFSNVTSHVAPGLPGVTDSFVAWGDYDNDGRLDFFLTGYDGVNRRSQIWRNTGSGFSNVTARVAPGLPGVVSGSVAWGDYDNDGRLDFVLTGGSPGPTSQLWWNTGGGFSNVTTTVAPGLPGVRSSSVAWGDYDNDSRLDFLLAGETNTGGFCASQLWRNTGSGFSNVTATVAPGLPGVRSSSVAWGDYDNDGRLDFLLTGVEGVFIRSQLWRNTGSGFSNVTATVTPGLPQAHPRSVAWGDYDNDGRLDFLLPAVGSVPTPQLWRNNLPLSNAPPAAPAGLSATFSNSSVTFNWSAPADDHTPAPGQSYNLRVGTTPGGSDVIVPMSLSNGVRLLPSFGNAQMLKNARYLLPPGRTYFWSVQAVDTGFAGSPFSAEQQFTVGPLLNTAARPPGGVFECFFTNQTSVNFDVFVSTNVALPLSSWVNIGPATPLGGGSYRFTDAGASNQAQRFYLLRGQ